MKKTSITILTSAWLGSVALAVWAGREWTKPAPAGPNNSGPRATTVADAARRLAAEGSLKPGSLDNATSREWGTAAAGELGLKFSDDPEKRAEEIAAFAAEIFKQEDPLARMQQFVALTAALKDGEDIKSAMGKIMDGFDPRGRGREMMVLMNLWAGKDPEAAVEYTTKMDGRTAGWAAGTVLATWAKSNPDAAIAWAQAHGPKDPKSDEGNYNMVGVISGLAKVDLDRAAKLALAEPRSNARGEMMDRVLDAFQKQRGDDSARQWAQTLPEGPFRDGVLRRVTERTMNDPQQTAQWVSSLPDGAGKPGAMAALVDRWAGKDPNAAGTWLNNYPVSPETDEPRRAFAWAIRERDPESALVWAGTVSDNERRTRLTFDIAREWAQRDPEAARGWVQTNPAIDQRTRERLMRRIDDRRDG